MPRPEISDWRTRTWWPIGIVEANEIAAAQAHRALGFVAALDPEKARDAALLALPNILAYGRAIVMAAIAVKRASDMGVRFISYTPEFAFLDSGEGAIPDRSASILPPVSIRHEFARRVMRVHSWSGLWRTVPAMLRPDILAISHNTLLHRAASGSRERVGFRHADLILGTHVSPRWRPNADARDIARALARILLGDDVPEEPLTGRTLRLLETMAVPHLGRAMRDIAALREAALPSRIWSGSGGLYAPRAVGLEVLSPRWRGRSLRPRKAEGVCGVVAISTQSWNIRCRRNSLSLPRQPPRFRDATAISISSLGERISQLKVLTEIQPLPRSRQNGRRDPESCGWSIAPTQLLGFRQLLPVQQPDVIYLSWQMQMVEALCALPVEFICQPHPEGLFGGKPHPLEGMADVRRGAISSSSYAKPMSSSSTIPRRPRCGRRHAPTPRSSIWIWAVA